MGLNKSRRRTEPPHVLLLPARSRAWATRLINSVLKQVAKAGMKILSGASLQLCHFPS
jgi:hypothetical protein